MVLKASVNIISINTEIGDVNRDGKINSADALLILRYSVGIITQF